MIDYRFVLVYGEGEEYILYEGMGKAPFIDYAETYDLKLLNSGFSDGVMTYYFTTKGNPYAK